MSPDNKVLELNLTKVIFHSLKERKVVLQQEVMAQYLYSPYREGELCIPVYV